MLGIFNPKIPYEICFEAKNATSVRRQRILQNVHNIVFRMYRHVVG